MLAVSNEINKLKPIVPLSTPKEDKYFEVALIDIENFAKTNNITCIKRNLYDKEREAYICISYRWGEVSEWITQATDYIAHITSFDKMDLWALCTAILKEPDLKSIKYLWVDAICIDQLNIEKRKATIQHMSCIYEFSDYILAVPDLHRANLERSPSNYLALDTTITYGRHIHYELMKKRKEETENKEDKDKAINDSYVIWKKDLDSQLLITWILGHLHPDLHKAHFHPPSFLKQLVDLKESSSDFRALLTLSEDANNFYEYLTSSLEYVVARAKDGKEEEMDWYKRNYFFDHIKYTPHSNYAEQMETFYGMAGQEYHSEMPDIKLLFMKWVFKYNEFKKDIDNAMNFLEYLMEDWANRAWVISEYHIAKKKTRPMKMTFVTLLKNIHWQFEQPRYMEENIYHQFIDIDLSSEEIKSNDDDEEEKEIKIEINDENELVGDEQLLEDEEQKENEDNNEDEEVFFIESVKQQLAYRPFLTLMLDSKATKSEDRFYAILKASNKYGDLVQGKDTVSSWSITGMVSVRLQLFKIMDLDDKIALLHACSNSNGALSPTFASIYTEGWTDIETLHFGNYFYTHYSSVVPKLELNFFEKNNNDQDSESTLTTSRVDIENMKKEDYIFNITSIEFNNDDEENQLTLECDMYYQLDGTRNKGPNPYTIDFQSSTYKFEWVVIPLYRFKNMERNKINTPSDCYLSLSRKKEPNVTHWRMAKVFTFEDITMDDQLTISSFDVGLDGMKLNGHFTIK
ncbi:hypothetical protein BJ944DRAFT_237562 [Cunninghamella echinulata]|nr:hypothetical protein BJ944DRAFT_237562 [Cunninghamella echinulata]